MKFIHLSDLHIGKRVNGFSMLEDQRFILLRILSLIQDEQPDAVLIAGDVYDLSVPSAEAVQVLDEFLVRLADMQVPTLIISGNHDSPERLAFAARLLAHSGIHLSRVYDGSVNKVTLKDQHGPVDFYLLPFIKPAHVRRYLENDGIDTYTDALSAVIEHMQVDESRRNVLLTHQFITGSTRSESEEISVGGADNVDARVFAPFDYVALGHLHGPQSAGGQHIRYCGSPLKYSFSECRQQKSLTVVEMEEKGQTTLRLLPLKPKREMREIRGSFEDIVDKAASLGPEKEDYLHITLTDEQDILEGMGRLRVHYPYLMKLSYDNQRTRQSQRVGKATGADSKTPLQLFEDLYTLQNNQPMSAQQQGFCAALIENIWEDKA